MQNALNGSRIAHRGPFGRSMTKRIVLFVATNLAIVAMVTALMTILGAVGLAVGPDRLPLIPLAAACMAWGVLGALVSLWLARWIAKRSLKIRLVDGKTGDNDLDWLHGTAKRLADRASIPMPEIGIYESPEVNAFATGRSRRRSLVAVSTGLLSNMSRDEVAGVLGHELAHIANGDMVTMALLQGVLNAFVLFFVRLAVRGLRRRLSVKVLDAVAVGARIVLEFALAIFGAVIVAWFSRRREFRADRQGASLAGGTALVAALKQLVRTRDRIDASRPALAAFKIAGGGAWFELLATHPPLEKRISALERAAPPGLIGPGPSRS
jgi:heat shock protein HtpX